MNIKREIRSDDILVLLLRRKVIGTEFFRFPLVAVKNTVKNSLNSSVIPIINSAFI